MLRRRLDFERHGSDGFTSVSRLAVIGLAFGFFVVAVPLLTKTLYDGRMLPGVTVAGASVGGLTLAQTRQVIQKKVADYRLKLNVAGERYELTATQLGATFDVEATLVRAYESGRNELLLPLHHEPIALTYELNRTDLNAFATSVVAKVGTQPVDAAVVVKAGTFEQVPEKSGWSIDKLGLVRVIEADLAAPGGDSIALKPREQLADIQTRGLGATIAQAKVLMATPIVLSYADKTFTPNQAEIGQWLAFVKQSEGGVSTLVPQVDATKLKSYVQTIANKLDVSPVNKKVTVENGVSKTEVEGVEGIAVDQDPLTAAITAAVKGQTPLTYTITAHPVPFKTISTNLVSLDLGRYIEVNISKQHLWVWQDKNVIFDTAITSGATGAKLGTVTGLFSIYYKTTNTRLRGYQYGYDYDVPVKYWMPFYQGYGLHDATWRNGNFGGQDYYYGGSHGCVNLPDAAAAFIYNWATVGTPVWVHN